MAEKPRYRALASIDPQELAQFQAGIRKRYTDEQIVAEIVACAERLGRLPKFADWGEARRKDDSLLTEWQVYRMFEARRGAWSTFQFLVRQRLTEQGRDVASDGTLL